VGSGECISFEDRNYTGDDKKMKSKKSNKFPEKDTVIGGIRTVFKKDDISDTVINKVITLFTSYGFRDVKVIKAGRGNPICYRKLITTTGHPDEGVADILKKMEHGERCFVVSAIGEEMRVEISPFGVDMEDWNKVDKVFRINRDLFFALYRAVGNKLTFDNMIECPKCKSGDMQRHGWSIISGGSRIRRYRCKACGWVGSVETEVERYNLKQSNEV